MNQIERFCLIESLLRRNKVVSRDRLLSKLNVSLATFKRDLAFMRERLNAPIKYDSQEKGYYLSSANVGPSFSLPNVWFNAEEIHALLCMQQLLKELQPGLLSLHTQSFMERITQLLGSTVMPLDEIQKRIRLLKVNARPIPTKDFDVISNALLHRHKLEIYYYHRLRNIIEPRKVSPQRLIYYRDNWYLDAWCHEREAMRSFSLDAIKEVTTTEDLAIDITDEQMNAIFTAGYGIFNGQSIRWAALRFTPERARWVSREQWHPQQISELTADGHYLLRIPYSDDRELIMDIMRHMPEVTVESPESLKTRVAGRLKKSLEKIENIK